MAKIPNPADMVGGFINGVNDFVTENWQLVLLAGGVIILIGFVLTMKSYLGV